jgi:hypothetical protein
MIEKQTNKIEEERKQIVYKMTDIKITLNKFYKPKKKQPKK